MLSIKESCGRRTGALRGRRSTVPQPLGIGGLRLLRFGADELSHDRPRSLGAVRESLPLRQDGVPCVRDPLAADSMHAVHPGFLNAIAQIHQLPERPPLTLSFVSPHIEGLKGSVLAKFQHDLRPRNPIRAFAENQMADDIERVPSAFTFISNTQKCIKSSGS